jgi:hypothetical protein
MAIGACEYLVLCVLALVPLWIAQMITGLVPCVNHCVLVLFIQGTHLFCLGFYPVFCYMVVWSSYLYTARCNLGLIKKTIPVPVSRNIYASVTHSNNIRKKHYWSLKQRPGFSHQSLISWQLIMTARFTQSVSAFVSPKTILWWFDKCWSLPTPLCIVG